MTTYVTPKKSTAWIGYIGLTQQADTRLLKANPTLAAGDFKVSIDGGTFSNLTTLPTVTPTGGTAVKLSLSAGEMAGDNIVIACIDAAGAEWCDQFVTLQTTARQIDDLAYPAVPGRSLAVDSAGSVAIQTILKKGQAITGFEFLMTDSTAHAPATGKTVTATRSIDGGAFAAGTLGAVSEISSGFYKLDLPAADLNGNVVTVRFTASACDDTSVTLYLEP